MAVFDRSWYGRVLVERVEGFATEDEWTRAYDEIDEFERMLADEGTVLIKFWLHISERRAAEALRGARRDPLKRWKLTDEDWRNREAPRRLRRGHRGRCSSTPTTSTRPGTSSPADSKQYARVKVVETVNKEIEKAMRLHGIDPPS